MQSNKWRFFGSESELGDTKYDRLGQVAEFDDKLSYEVLHGGAKFLPESQFNSIFTETDCQMFPYMNGFPMATPELVAKRRRALDASHELLHELQKQFATVVVEDVPTPAASIITDKGLSHLHPQEAAE
jgi:hypothetical protein